MTAIPTAPTPGPVPVGALPVTDIAREAIALPALHAARQTPSPTLSVRTDGGVRVLLVEELERMASHVSSLIFDDRDVELVETVRDGRSAMERIVEIGPDVVIIDALVQGDVSGLKVAQMMRESGLTTPIVFMTVPDLPVKLNADTGIAEVLTLPFEGEALLSTIVRVDTAHRGPVVVPPAGMIAVFSAKGGVGRTAIAHNLAVAMSHSTGTRTVLVDGDQVHGDLRLHLEAPESAPSLVQLPTGHVTEEDMAPLLWQDATGLDVLLAPPRMEEADLIMLADVRRAQRMLKRIYDRGRHRRARGHGRHDAGRA